MAHVVPPASPRTLTWGLFVLVALFAVFIVTGFSTAPLSLLLIVFLVGWAYRYIYASFYAAIALVPFLGLMLSAPTGNLLIGQRAFGGSIDISLGEAFLFCILAAWALKLLFLWIKRHDINWRPRLPLAWPMLGIVTAHVLSVFSPLQPDPYIVLKFSMRPVLFDYLAYVALPVNLIRSRRRLVAALSVFAGVGIFAALTGLVAMFLSPDAGSFIGRAHPLPLFGVSVLGGNHNELAELLVATAPIALALSLIAKSARLRRLWGGGAAFMFVMGLLTFTRTAWIVFAAEILIIGFTEFRAEMKKHAARLILLDTSLFTIGDRDGDLFDIVDRTKFQFHPSHADADRL